MSEHKHNQVRHKLSEYIDGSVSPGDKAEIERHIETCTECREAVAELRKTIEHIRSLEQVEPPAWMTQKIMARVHTDEAKKGNLLTRLLFPLHVKLPLEALGVLFLAVTAFFVFRNQPTADHADGIVSEQRLAQHSLPGKDVQRQPGYRTLDMKPEYEKAAPPASAEKSPIPGLRQPEGSAGSEGLQPESSQSPPASIKSSPSPAFSTPAPRSEANSDTFAERQPDAKAFVRPGDQLFRCSLFVDDGKKAALTVEEAARRLGGNIERNGAVGKTTVMRVSIDADKIEQFLDKLKAIGELQEKNLQPEAGGRYIIEVAIRQR